MPGYILAIDQGTTSSRAIVFDSEREPIASDQKEITQSFPAPGLVEHDAEEIWRTVVETARNAIAKAGVSAENIAGSLIRLFGWPLALLMAVGATAGALNTMMSSVFDSTVEIATVRALGLIASWLAFNGWQASTIGANNARMAFQLTVTPDVMLVAGLLGLAIGILGGAFPAIAATRLPLTAALRHEGSEQYKVARRDTTHCPITPVSVKSPFPDLAKPCPSHCTP